MHLSRLLLAVASFAVVAACGGQVLEAASEKASPEFDPCPLADAMADVTLFQPDASPRDASGDVAPCVPIEAGPDPRCPTCLFEEEFDGPLDPAKWIVVEDWTPQSPARCYLGANLAITDAGTLVEATHYAPDAGCASTWTDGGRGDYTASLIETRALFTPPVTFEVRWKIGASVALWQTNWLNGYECQLPNVLAAYYAEHCPWPYPGADEIDLSETNGGTTNVLVSLHSFAQSPFFNATGVARDVWHVETGVWTSGSFVVSIDGVQRATFTGDGVPRFPMFLMVETDVLPTYVSPSNAESSAEFDYVRVTSP